MIKKNSQDCSNTQEDQLTLFLMDDDKDVLRCLEFLDEGGLGGGLPSGLRGSFGEGVDIVGRESNDMAPNSRPGDPEVL